VKIDVEGFEGEVLAGLSAPLPALSFEYLPAARRIALDCVDRLGELGDYRFNWSVGESHVLATSEWVSPAAVRRFIAASRLESGSGDIYARLRR
jgi:hypothetical protein